MKKMKCAINAHYDLAPLKKKKKKDTTSLLVACLSEHKVLIVFDHKR